MKPTSPLRRSDSSIVRSLSASLRLTSPCPRRRDLRLLRPHPPVGIVFWHLWAGRPRRRPRTRIRRPRTRVCCAFSRQLRQPPCPRPGHPLASRPWFLFSDRAAGAKTPIEKSRLPKAAFPCDSSPFQKTSEGLHVSRLTNQSRLFDRSRAGTAGGLCVAFAKIPHRAGQSSD